MQHLRHKSRVAHTLTLRLNYDICAIFPLIKFLCFPVALEQGLTAAVIAYVRVNQQSQWTVPHLWLNDNMLSMALKADGYARVDIKYHLAHLNYYRMTAIQIMVISI